MALELPAALLVSGFTRHTTSAEQKPRLGIEVTSMSMALGPGKPAEPVLVVSRVEEGWLCHAAQVQPGDILMMWNDVKVNSQAQLLHLFESAPYGSTVALTCRSKLAAMDDTANRSLSVRLDSTFLDEARVRKEILESLQSHLLCVDRTAACRRNSGSNSPSVPRTIDPRTNLPLVPVPDIAATEGLEDALLHFCDKVQKLGRNGGVQDRVLFITDNCVAFTHTDSREVTRYVPVNEIQTVLVSPENLRVGLKIPAQYDLLFNLKSKQELENVVEILSRTHEYRTGRMLALTNADLSTASYPQLLQLAKPKGYIMHVEPLHSVEEIFQWEATQGRSQMILGSASKLAMGVAARVAEPCTALDGQVLRDASASVPKSAMRASIPSGGTKAVTFTASKESPGSPGPDVAQAPKVPPLRLSMAPVVHLTCPVALVRRPSSTHECTLTVTATAVILNDASGAQLRSAQIKDITKILVDNTDDRIGLEIPSEYDVLLALLPSTSDADGGGETPGGRTARSIADLLCRLREQLTPGQAPKVVNTDGRLVAEFETLLQLRRPTWLGGTPTPSPRLAVVEEPKLGNPRRSPREENEALRKEVARLEEENARIRAELEQRRAADTEVAKAVRHAERAQKTAAELLDRLLGENQRLTERVAELEGDQQQQLDSPRSEPAGGDTQQPRRPAYDQAWLLQAARARLLMQRRQVLALARIKDEERAALQGQLEAYRTQISMLRDEVERLEAHDPLRSAVSLWGNRRSSIGPTSGNETSRADPAVLHRSPSPFAIGENIDPNVNPFASVEPTGDVWHKLDTCFRLISTSGSRQFQAMN